MKPPIVVPVTNPSSHRMTRIIAIVYNINSFLFFGCRLASFTPADIESEDLVVGHRHSNGHVIDHAGHTVDVGGEFGDEAFFSIVFGNTTQGDDAVRR